MTRTITYTIALGGNIGDTKSFFERAMQQLETHGTITARSNWHITPPLLNPVNPIYNQDPFLNGVILFNSELCPQELLIVLNRIEQNLGRVRAQIWGPRTIDLDVIAAEDQVINSRALTIPHPAMQYRDFVLAPMAEVSPDWVHPLLQLNVTTMLARLRAKTTASQPAPLEEMSAML